MSHHYQVYPGRQIVPNFSLRVHSHPVIHHAHRRHSDDLRTPRSYTPNTDIFLYTQHRQWHPNNGYPTNQQLVSNYVSRQLPGRLMEKEYDLGQINKIFAASWVTDRQVVFGTKCNKVRYTFTLVHSL